MAGGEIPRHENGLIIFDGLAPYYPPKEMVVPFGVCTFPTDLKNHHAYYLYSLWNEPHLPLEQRDFLRIHFRGSVYNRLILLQDDEERLHRDVKIVDPALLQESAAEASLRDFAVFDQLGAAALGLNISFNPSREYSIKGPAFNTTVSNVPREERLSFFAAKRDEALRQLETPEVTPEEVVTSVIARYAQHLGDASLMEVAEERMDGSNITHPFDLPIHQHLRDMANVMLKTAFPPDESESTFEEAA